MLSAYPACFLKEESGYSVIFPDLNYLATCGATLDEALLMAVDCLAGYLYSQRREGCSVPGPSAMQAVDPQAVAADLEIPPEEAFVNIITVDVEEYARTH